MTIRTRWTLWYSSMLALIVIMMGLTVLIVNRASTLATVDQFLKQTATLVRNNLNFVPVGEFGPLRFQLVVAEPHVLNVPSVWVQVWQVGAEDRTVAPSLVVASQALDDNTHALDPAALQTTQNEQVSERVFNGTLTRVVTSPVIDELGRLLGYVQVGTSIATLDRANDALLVTMVVATVASVFASVILGAWLSGRLLKPIEHMTLTANSIMDAEDLSTRLVWQGPDDELGRLTSVFNQMMARLEHLFSVQQRFVGDVSHELRTPLTSILGNLELIQRYGYDKESIDAVHREAERMSRMVSDLLLLARADNGELKVTLSPMDLDPIVVEVYEQAHMLAKKRALKIELMHVETTRINGNPDRIKQLLLNLLNNAIKFTEDGGKITLALTHEKDRAKIVVKDTGIGISEADLVRIFDRFYQADNSRVQRNDGDGAGLGLPIARWLAEAHGGYIDVMSKQQAGTTFTVCLPLLGGDPLPRKKTPTGVLKRSDLERPSA